MKSDLTYKQHLSWSLDGEPFANRLADDQKFTFKLGQLTRTPKGWVYEFKEALTKLVDEHGTKLDVLFSGGADSEVLVRGLVALGVKPNLHTIQFTNELNSHETVRVSSVASSLGLQPVFHAYDMLKALRDESYLDLALKLQCSQLAYLTVVQCLSSFDNPAVMGGEVYVQKHQSPSPYVVSPQDWYYVYREDEDGMTYRYTKLTSHPLINEVMSYTPELLYCWLTHPAVLNTVRGGTPGKITVLSVKNQVYESELGLKLDANTKYHGYERLSWSNRSVSVRLKELWPKQATIKIPHASLVAYLENGFDLKN